MGLGNRGGAGRYIVLGFLDSAVTALAISSFTGGLGDIRPGPIIYTALMVTFINLVPAFMAEYTEERGKLGRIERSLMVRRGFMLRTTLHREAIIDALHRGVIYGSLSFVAAVTMQLSSGFLVIGQVPILSLAILGAFGSIVSRYFGGNPALWLGIYVAIGLAAVLMGHALRVLNLGLPVQ